MFKPGLCLIHISEMVPIKHTHRGNCEIAIHTPIVKFPPFGGWKDKVFYTLHPLKKGGNSQESKEDCSSWYCHNHPHHLAFAKGFRVDKALSWIITHLLNTENFRDPEYKITRCRVLQLTRVFIHGTYTLDGK